MVTWPKHYQKLKNLPGDIKGMSVYGTATDKFQTIIKEIYINKKGIFPSSKEEAIDGLHHVLDIDQGLIEVDVIKTNKGSDFFYSIIKNKLEPSGAQYFLRLSLDLDGKVLDVQAFSDELGLTGERDATIYALLGLKDSKQWMKDPYDPNYKKGFLMNLSEDPKYDEMFYNHPLSELRRLVKHIKENY